MLLTLLNQNPGQAAPPATIAAVNLTDAKIYVGDTGTTLNLDTKVSLAGATVAILAERPDDTKVIWPAAAVGMVARYVTLAADLNQPGTWKLQARVTTAAGRWLGKTITLKVYDEFK